MWVTGRVWVKGRIWMKGRIWVKGRRIWVKGRIWAQVGCGLSAPASASPLEGEIEEIVTSGT